MRAHSLALQLALGALLLAGCGGGGGNGGDGQGNAGPYPDFGYEQPPGSYQAPGSSTDHAPSAEDPIRPTYDSPGSTYEGPAGQSSGAGSFCAGLCRLEVTLGCGRAAAPEGFSDVPLPQDLAECNVECGLVFLLLATRPCMKETSETGACVFSHIDSCEQLPTNASASDRNVARIQSVCSAEAARLASCENQRLDPDLPEDPLQDPPPEN